MYDPRRFLPTLLRGVSKGIHERLFRIRSLVRRPVFDALEIPNALTQLPLRTGSGMVGFGLRVVWLKDVLLATTSMRPCHRQGRGQGLLAGPRRQICSFAWYVFPAGRYLLRFYLAYGDVVQERIVYTPTLRRPQVVK